MPSSDGTSRKRKLRDELLNTPRRRRQEERADRLRSVEQNHEENMRKLRDGRQSDVIIKCQGRNIDATGAVLAAGCQFFERCLAGEFKESANRVIEMNDDDPDALEILIDYLHPPADTIKRIEKWKRTEESGSSAEDEKDRCYHRFRGTFWNGQQCGELPRGYLPFLANVLTVAEKYGQPLLEDVVASMFKLPDTKEPRQVCRKCQASGKMYDIRTARELEIYKVYINNKEEVVEALAILSRLPDSCKVREEAKEHVMEIFDDPDFTKHFEFDGQVPVRLNANTSSRLSVKSVVAEDPEIFLSLLKRHREVSETSISLRITNRQLQAQIDSLKAELADRSFFARRTAAAIPNGMMARASRVDGTGLYYGNSDSGSLPHDGV